MGFLTPFMLAGAVAAAIPVAIHLFFRSRYRTVPWAAMKFLLTSVEQTSRRLKFQELLLLLLRMALLVMLALAFARPVSSLLRGAGRGDAVDAVFVIDLSYSMGATDGAKTRLERARDEARKIIDELPGHSTVQIITCAGNQKTLIGPRSPANLDQARLLIDELEVTHMASDLSLGVNEAQRVLKDAHSANKELYIFSDMQKLGFDQQAAELKAALTQIKEKTLVHMVRCGTRTPKNVAIIGITPQSGIPRPGERGFAVLVRNTGTESLENLRVSLVIDEDEKKNMESTEVAKIPPGETRAVPLTGKLDKPGLRILTAKVKHDDLEADNRFDQVILVRDQVNVLVVDGNPNDKEPQKASSFFLNHALVPVKEGERGGYKINPRLITARAAAPALLAKQDICILVNAAVQAKAGGRAESVLPADFVEALDPFVREGRGLIIFSGDNVQVDAYNKLLGKKLGLLPMPLKPVIKATDVQAAKQGIPGVMPGKAAEPFYINRESFGAGPSSFRTFKEDDYYKDFGKVEVWQHFELDQALHTDIEQLQYRFYKQAWNELPDFNVIKEPDAKGELPRGLIDLSPRTRNQEFGFVFEGTLVVPENGKYTFYLDSADGARVYVSGKEVVTNDGIHELGDEVQESVILQKGKQPIKVEYFQRRSRPGLLLAWSSAHFSRRPLSVAQAENPLSIVARLNTDKPLIVSKKIERGEVIFVGTAAHHEGLDPKTLNPLWTDFSTSPEFVPFVDIMVNHLLQNQVHTYNLSAGQVLNWYPPDKQDNIYDLVSPATPQAAGKATRLGQPERKGKGYVVTATDLPRAGIYRMVSRPRGSEVLETTDSRDLIKTSSPIAVTPDLRESADLTSLSKEAINTQLGFEPIHIIAGDTTAVSTGEERLNREWTVWVLMIVLMMVLCETLLAWWCSRSW